jgi:protein involved in ribonucleotide reduction
MLIIYLSLTGNVRNFVQRVGMENVEINYSNPFTEVDKDYIVISPTYDHETTEIISEFIDYKNNVSHLVGFAGSGNRNFDNDFCFNARDLSKKYNKPLLFKFEFSGNENEINEFKEEVNKFEITRTEQ